MMLQLNPSIPVWTEKGMGEAWVLIDYSKEDGLYWVVAMDETSEIWVVPNHEVKACKNWSLGRRLEHLDNK
jgi:hypothetical protein